MQNPLRILLAEDDEDDRIFFNGFLYGRKDLFIMPAAQGGIELMEILEKTTDEMLPHLIILDHNMPRLNGLQTINALKANKRFMNIPVMVYSTYANAVLEESCKNAGCLLVLSKPSDKEGYNSMIDDFLAAAERGVKG